MKAENRQVISCQSIRSAREQLSLGDASLVLLNVNLPDGSGLDFLREIRTASPSVPVFLLTASGCPSKESGKNSVRSSEWTEHSIQMILSD